MSGSEQINLHSQLEKKHVELEVFMIKGEQSCMQHDMLIQRGREGLPEDGADYEV